MKLGRQSNQNSERCEKRLERIKIEVIRLILEFDFPIRVGSEKHLSTRIDTPAVEVMRLEYIGVVEVAHATAAPVDCVMAGEICHEAAEVLNPRIVIVPEEEVYHLLVTLLRDVEWMSGLAFVVLK